MSGYAERFLRVQHEAQAGETQRLDEIERRAQQQEERARVRTLQVWGPKMQVAAKALEDLRVWRDPAQVNTLKAVVALAQDHLGLPRVEVPDPLSDDYTKQVERWQVMSTQGVPEATLASYMNAYFSDVGEDRIASHVNLLRNKWTVERGAPPTQAQPSPVGAPGAGITTMPTVGEPTTAAGPALPTMPSPPGTEKPAAQSGTPGGAPGTLPEAMAPIQEEIPADPLGFTLAMVRSSGLTRDQRNTQARSLAENYGRMAADPRQSPESKARARGLVLDYAAKYHIEDPEVMLTVAEGKALADRKQARTVSFTELRLQAQQLRWVPKPGFAESILRHPDDLEQAHTDWEKAHPDGSSPYEPEARSIARNFLSAGFNISDPNEQDKYLGGTLSLPDEAQQRTLGLYLEGRAKTPSDVRQFFTQEAEAQRKAEGDRAKQVADLRDQLREHYQAGGREADALDARQQLWALTGHTGPMPRDYGRYPSLTPKEQGDAARAESREARAQATATKGGGEKPPTPSEIRTINGRYTTYFALQDPIVGKGKAPSDVTFEVGKKIGQGTGKPRAKSTSKWAQMPEAERLTRRRAIESDAWRLYVGGKEPTRRLSGPPETHLFDNVPDEEVLVYFNTPPKREAAAPATARPTGKTPAGKGHAKALTADDALRAMGVIK